MSEKRRWIRAKPGSVAAKTGKLLFGAKAVPVDCTVVDMSASGAALELSCQQDVPREFEFLHGGIRKACFLVWRRGYRIGISFVGSVRKSGVSLGSSRLSRARR